MSHNSVKTRRRVKEDEEESLLRNMHPSMALQRMCVATPPKSASKRPNENTSVKKKLKFAADPPVEHRFEFTSPPARRLEVQNANDVHDSVVRLEFEARKGDLPPPRQITDEHRGMLNGWNLNDRQSKLLREHGLKTECQDFVKLNERIKLAETLRRRGEIRRAQLEFMPHELAMRDIQKALIERKIEHCNLSYHQACEALELSLLKEDAVGLIGDGYHFGRRRVSAKDIIEFQHLSPNELRDLLLERNVAKKDLPKLKSERFKMLSDLIEAEEEAAVRVIVKKELELEMKRRNIPLHVPVQTETEFWSEEQFNRHFETLFESQVWTEIYGDVDGTLINLEGVSSGNCVVC